MNRLRFKLVDIVCVITIIMADLLVYAILGLLFMGYDDTYTPGKGSYLSLGSMTNYEKLIYILINLWHVVNIILIVWSAHKIYKWLNMRHTQLL